MKQYLSYRAGAYAPFFRFPCTAAVAWEANVTVMIYRSHDGNGGMGPNFFFQKGQYFSFCLCSIFRQDKIILDERELSSFDFELIMDA